MSLNLKKSAWKRVTLSDVVANINDYFNPDADGVLPYVAGPHINSGEATVAGYGSTDDAKFPPTFKRKFQPNDVLLHSRGIGKLASVDRAGVTGEKLFVLRSKNENCLLQSFLVWIIQSPEAQAHMRDNFTGSVNKFLNWKPLAAMELHLPPLEEQKRIADLLWAMEHHARSMSPEPLRGVEGQLLDELLRVEAPKVRVKEIGSVLMGRQRSPQHAQGDHMMPYLRVANIGEDQLRLDDIKTMNFTPEEQERYRVEPADILVSEGQSRELVGQSALVTELPEQMCFQNTLIRFRPDRHKVRPEYAQSLFRACLKNGIFADLATQTTSIAHLGVQRFASLELPLPTLDEQDEMLMGLEAISSGIVAASSELAALESLRSSFLAEIFGDR